MISIGARRFFSTTTKDLVQYQVNDRIGTLMLNDPDRLNCMTEAMGQALEGKGVLNRKSYHQTLKLIRK